MTNWVGPIGVCLLFGGSAGAAAQQQTFACDKICWTPAHHSATCSSKLSQADLTAYIYAVRHNVIAKGKGITFHLDLKSKGQTCASPRDSRAIHFRGRVCECRERHRLHRRHLEGRRFDRDHGGWN